MRIPFQHPSFPESVAPSRALEHKLRAFSRTFSWPIVLRDGVVCGQQRGEFRALFAPVRREAQAGSNVTRWRSGSAAVSRTVIASPGSTPCAPPRARPPAGRGAGCARRDRRHRSRGAELPSLALQHTASARSITARSIWPPSASARAITRAAWRRRRSPRPVPAGRWRSPAGADDVAVGEAAKRRGGVRIGRGHRRVPRNDALANGA